MFLAVSSNHCSWNDWLSIKMFHNFLFIVRKGLKSAGLKCGVRKTTSERFWRPWDEAYLPGREVNHDHEGGSSRARLLHCTKEWLTPAISPNVGNSTSSFLLVGICVRANPCNLRLDRPKGIPLMPQLEQCHSNFYIRKSRQMAPPLEWGPALFLCNSVLGSKIELDLTSCNWDCFPLIPILFSIFITELKRCIQTADWLDSMWLLARRANGIFQLCPSALTLRSGDTLTNDRLERWCYC